MKRKLKSIFLVSGWNKGSIAYHADDGKVFVGSGVGSPFGPRCHKVSILNLESILLIFVLFVFPILIVSFSVCNRIKFTMKHSSLIAKNGKLSILQSKSLVGLSPNPQKIWIFCLNLYLFDNTPFVRLAHSGQFNGYLKKT